MGQPLLKFLRRHTGYLGGIAYCEPLNPAEYNRAAPGRRKF